MCLERGAPRALGTFSEVVRLARPPLLGAADSEKAESEGPVSALDFRTMIHLKSRKKEGRVKNLANRFF